MSVDPLASEYPSYRDFAYVAGNPIIFIDPDGRNTIYNDDKKYFIDSQFINVRLFYPKQNTLQL